MRFLIAVSALTAYGRSMTALQPGPSRMIGIGKVIGSCVADGGDVDPRSLTRSRESHVQVLAAEVRGALQMLAEHERRVLEMAYFADLTHREIATRLRETPAGPVPTSRSW